MSHPTDSTSDRPERRAWPRHAAQGRVRLAVEASELDAQADNLSRGGVLLFADGELRVRVELEEEGRPVVREGRIIRTQRMRDGRSGIAIEFLEPIEGEVEPS